MIQQIGVGDAELTPHAAEAYVARAEHQTPDPGMDQRSGTHGTRLERNVQSRAGEAVVPRRFAGGAKREHLRVGCWIRRCNRRIGRLGEKLARFVHQHRSYGHLTPAAGLTRQGQRRQHPPLVGHNCSVLRHLPLAFRNATRNRRRSVLTVCSVAASLCLLGVMMALYHALFLSPATKEQALRLVTRNRISITNIMPWSYKQKIASVPGVRSAIVMQWFGGVYKEPKYVFGRMAVEPEAFELVYPEYRIVEGSYADFKRERSACIIGRDLARTHNLKVGDRMTLVGDIFPVTMDFTVRGIYDFASDNESMYFQLPYLFDALRANGSSRDFAGLIVSLADSPDSVPRIAREVDEMFRNSPVQTRTESEKAFQLGFIALLGNVKVFLMSICAAVTFTILLVTANTMAMSVRERTREVGVLKTLGYTNGAILGIILAEAAVLSLIGGVIGAGLAQMLTGVIRQMPSLFAEFKTLTILPPVAAMLLAIAVTIGVASAFIPAWNASRTNIIDALRSTG
jgi:putative ABC transport system permease protein